jgi:small subunit ribosomal protein S17
VVSDKNDKTVVVRVERRFTHPVLKKTVRRSKSIHAHDEKNEFGRRHGMDRGMPDLAPRWAVQGEKRWKVLPRDAGGELTWISD